MSGPLPQGTLPQRTLPPRARGGQADQAKKLSSSLNQTVRLFVPFIGEDGAFHYYVSAGRRYTYLNRGRAMVPGNGRLGAAASASLVDTIAAYARPARGPGGGDLIDGPDPGRPLRA